MSNSTESNNRKEEILEKNRQSGNDEGVEFAQAKGRNLLSCITLAIGIVPFMFLARFSDLDYAFSIIIHTMVITIFSTYIAEPISAYRFAKKKSHLTLACCFAVIGVSSAYQLVSVLMGW